MVTIQTLLNSFVFWSAWIIIPVLVEIIPSIGCVFMLVKRRIQHRGGYPELQFDPEITLIVPVYNSADSLEACIRSIDQSTYPNSKIDAIFVDNGSEDESFQVFARCQELFPDVRMQWSSAQQGKSKALNLALYNSEGEYIINIDSDGVLDPKALENLVRKYEACPDINCMTGAVLTRPDLVMEYKSPASQLFRRLEFMEYAQAFLAGRSYASEFDMVYTLSGAFSSFRKSAILQTFMYDTTTISEDTQLTFQIRYLHQQKVEMCDEAIFYVEPIEDVNKLYTQRQRWQRGSLEVAHMFGSKRLAPWRLADVGVQTLLFDHTFAFPRVIWYVALLCLMALSVSVKTIALSVLLIFALYVVVGYMYFACVLALLKMDPPLRAFYLGNWWVVALLPFFNLGVFFIRLAGIVNSIGTSGAWKTRNLTEEGAAFREAVREQARAVTKPLRALRRAVNKKEAHEE